MRARACSPGPHIAACAAALACVLGLPACGAREVAPVPAYGPPPRRLDPVACPEAMLRALEARLPGAQLAIALEPVVDAARIDQLPCGDLADAACLARARQRPVPAGYEVATVAIGGATAVEVTYVVDGRRYTEQAASLAAMVQKLEGLQAEGHTVRILAGESVGDVEARHAAITYRPVGGPQRRVGTYRWAVDDADRAAAMAEVHAAAEATRLQVRGLDVAERELVITATCAGLVHAELPPE